MGQSGVTAGVLKVGFALALPLLLIACSDQKETAADENKPLPGVVVQAVTAKDVSDQIDFVGRTAAFQRVDIRARVIGTLLKRPFEEGGEVKEGAVLYEIDPAEFEANLLTANAQVAKAEASLKQNERNRERYEVLLKKGTASQAQYDIAESKANQSKADVSSGEAEVERAKLDLGYATITSPISGRTGISRVDAGNLIGPDSGILVTVLDLDPIDVFFSIGEREYLNYMEATKAGTDDKFTPRIRLANDKLYPLPGKVDIVDNKVDPATGTISIRLKFPNPDRILVPGQYVSVLLTRAKPENRVVIPQSAVQENQAGPFVLVVDGKNRIESRPVKMGSRFGTGVVVLEGLNVGETLVVEGIQKVRPGGEVKATFQKPSDIPETDAALAAEDDGADPSMAPAKDAPGSAPDDGEADDRAKTGGADMGDDTAEPEATTEAKP